MQEALCFIVVEGGLEPFQQNTADRYPAYISKYSLTFMRTLCLMSAKPTRAPPFTYIISTVSPSAAQGVSVYVGLWPSMTATSSFSALSRTPCYPHTLYYVRPSPPIMLATMLASNTPVTVESAAPQNRASVGTYFHYLLNPRLAKHDGDGAISHPWKQN